MRNDSLISKHLNDALQYLYEQGEKIKPCLEILEKDIYLYLTNNELSIDTAFSMYLKLLEQYTNSIMLVTKIKEIIDFKE